MRAASMIPVTGGASTDSLAASSGLNVPGGDTHHPVTVPTESAVHEPIPGERDATTLTHREPGAMGSYTGANLPAPDPGAWIDPQTAHERTLEGGGNEVADDAKDDAKGKR